MTEKNSI